VPPSLPTEPALSQRPSTARCVSGTQQLVSKSSRWAGDEDWVLSASFSRDGARIGTDGTARLWDAATAVEIVALRGHEDRVRSACFSPDGTRIATASDDRTSRLWTAATGQEIIALRTMRTGW
jgi:hypothetical protein